MSSGALINLTAYVPAEPQAEQAVAQNFERFDGLTPLDNNPGGEPLGADYSENVARPGQLNTPLAEQTFTGSPNGGLTNTLGGQPLPVADCLHRPPQNWQGQPTKSIQFRTGVGQNNQGVAQTVALSEITGNPPEPGDISSILAGWG